MAYGYNLQNPHLLLKTTFSFQLQLHSFTTFHVQKTYSMFLGPSKKLLISDNQHNNIYLPKVTNTSKQMQYFTRTFKSGMYANLAFPIQISIFSDIYKLINILLNNLIFFHHKYMNWY